MSSSGSSTTSELSETSSESQKDVEAAKPSPNPHGDYPEGGRGWLVVLGAFLLSFIGYGLMSSYGVYQSIYMARFPETSPNVISLIGSVCIALLYLLGPLVGFALEMLGPRPLVAISACLTSISYIGVGLTQPLYAQFLLQGVVQGFGQALAFYPCVAIPNHWFFKRRGLALGLTFAGSSIGGVVWPIFVVQVNQRVGWYWTNFAIGCIVFVLGMVACGLVIPRFPLRKPKKFIDIASFKIINFDLLFAAQGVLFFGLFTPFFFITPLAQIHKVEANLVFYLLSIMNGSSLVGRTSLGKLADLLGYYNTFIPSVFISGLATLVFWVVPISTGSIIAFAVIYGFFSGGVVALFTPCLVSIMGTENIGQRLGTMVLSAMPGAFVGTLITGSFVDKTTGSGYDKAAIFAGVVIMASAVLLTAIRLRAAKLAAVF